MNHRVLEHRARAVVALLLAIVAAFALSACGSDDDSSTTTSGGGGGGETADARTLLEETFTGTKDVRSGRFALSIRAGEDGGEQISVSLGGPFESQGGDDYPKFDIDASIDASGQGFRAGLISTSDRLFVEFDGSAYEVPAEYLEMARRQTGTEDRAVPALPDLDPQSWIENPEVVGTEQVGGVDTEHITADVNVAALMDSIDSVLAELDRQGLSGATGGQVPSSIPADARAQIERAVKDPRIDVWTGSDDKTVRKIELTTGVQPEGERAGSASLTFELTGLNEAQTIEAPANTRPIDELLAGLGGLLGASGLGGGAAGGGADADALGEYQRCLLDAAGDTAAQQKCADLLTR
ncbi:hypothetical protein VSS74_26955 [Conexibacter stalactiti]|uniref:LppX_LprAFG lipoprotein n=1 Tax=Conexibacter stalactiti TaxID=1940611 RepID=A0ABU4I137_9ACTN|nr:hypothetical protein [Conexibacter stalactiti]MDW5598024.1 hypothetical protein [Conexibacter stalactiti]MEC5038666.1 hypothetical protein [Conexibacter stalactiti]